MRGECAKKESAVLKRLGPVPFWRGERKCLDALGEMYSRAMESASRRLAATGRHDHRSSCALRHGADLVTYPQ